MNNSRQNKRPPFAFQVLSIAPIHSWRRNCQISVIKCVFCRICNICFTNNGNTDAYCLDQEVYIRAVKAITLWPEIKDVQESSES